MAGNLFSDALCVGVHFLVGYYYRVCATTIGGRAKCYERYEDHCQLLGSLVAVGSVARHKENGETRFYAASKMVVRINSRY